METRRPYKCRTSCGHVVVRMLTPRVAGKRYTRNAILSTPGGIPCPSCFAKGFGRVIGI